MERVGIGGAHDLRKPRQALVLQVVLLEESIEAAERTRMGQLDTWNVERHRALALSDVQYLRSGDVQNLGIGINKPPDQPGASEPIDLRPFTCDPFHLFAPWTGESRLGRCGLHEGTALM